MLYSIAAFAVRVFYKLIFFVKVEGEENIPQAGGMIFCGNHQCFHDPVLIAAFVKVKLKFLAKAELFKNKFPAWFFKSVGCVPVDRAAGDIKAMKTCINILKDGNPLVLFPEGTRSCKHIDDVKQGAILFAVKSQVPIIPVGISNIRPFGKTKITFGKPIYFDEYYDKKVPSETYKKLTCNLMLNIYDMVENKCCCYYDEIKASVENEH